MSEDQIFEFKGNAVLNFLVRVRPTSLSISTTRKRGAQAVKTWDVSFASLDNVRITERIGARTRSSALYLKPRDGELAMFAWQKNAVGALETDKKIYYAAATAALEALAEQRPDLTTTIGPDGRSSLIGAGLGAIVFIGVAYIGIGALNTIFWITAAAIAAAYAFSAATSGAFKPTRKIPLPQAKDELTANAAR